MVGSTVATKVADDIGDFVICGSIGLIILVILVFYFIDPRDH